MFVGIVKITMANLRFVSPFNPAILIASRTLKTLKMQVRELKRVYLIKKPRVEQSVTLAYLNNES